MVSDTDARTHTTLLKAEQAVIHQVGTADLEVLVPIAVLHHEAYRRLLARGGRGHALAMIHTRNMAKDLALLYSDQSGSEGAKLVASRLLTSIGGLLLQYAQQLPAAEMFQKAVELDPHNVPALLALATVYEKNAQALTAVKLLRNALVIEPANAEARLRLALNLKRLDQTAESRKLLAGLVAEKDPTWVTPLAYQELARLDIEEGKKGKSPEAEKLLREAIDRFPDDLRLRIQLASVLDRRGAPGEASALLDKAALGAPLPRGGLLPLSLQRRARGRVRVHPHLPRRELEVAPPGAGAGPQRAAGRRRGDGGGAMSRPERWGKSSWRASAASWRRARRSPSSTYTSRAPPRSSRCSAPPRWRSGSTPARRSTRWSCSSTAS